MPDHVPGTVKERRAAVLADLGERLRRRYFESLLGRRLEVLVETPHESHPGMLLGTSARYAPVELPAGRELLGRLVPATAVRLVGGRIHAES
jgi:tRNA A37 methylthiotransferase MiaB